MKRPGGWKTVIVALLLAGVGVGYMNRQRLLAGVARWLDVGERPRRADYVLALGGDPFLRPFVAAALVRSGYAQRVLISQVQALANDILPPDHELCRRVYLAGGVAAEKLIPLGDGHQSTYDEAHSLGAFLAGHRGAKVLVVTTAQHTRRARWIFGKALGDAAASVQFVSAPHELYQADAWWRSRWGASFVPAEYLRFAYYVWRYDAGVRWSVVAVSLLLLSAGVWRRLTTGGRAGALPRAA